MLKKTLQGVLFSRWAAFLHDLFWIPATFVLAYLLRFNFDGIPDSYTDTLLLLIGVSLPVQGTLFWLFGMYRGLWRFASIPDLLRIFKAVFFGTLCVTGIVFFVSRLENVPRSVLFLYPVLLSFGLCLPRFLYRWAKDQCLPLCTRESKRVIIIGAGSSGALLLRDLRCQDGYQPIGFLDDDPAKQGRDIHGVPILGKIEALDNLVTAFQAEEIIVAIPSASRKDMQHILKQCGTTGVPVRILPALQEMSDYQVSIRHLRSLTIEDLLGREAVRLDTAAIQAYLQGKSVLVTGGGGSIGSELCRQIASLSPGKLIVFDHGEYNLYQIEHELRRNFPQLHLVVVLGDVKNRDRVDWVFGKFHPDVVFHAAAYKHVPMVELNPAEGVANNVWGTKMVADAADRYGSDRFVQVSTDKAVNPANVMGTTKRIGEIYCQNLDKYSKTRFITTRFGNVLGSAGSVVPLFQRQIEEGGPVTVTHPEITRYFMTIPEAVSLILQAGAMGEGGEIFVLDMGEPVLIRHLAEQMITLFGLKPGEDIEIVYTGLRPGEKLYEEVLHESEGLEPTTHEKLLLARSRRVEWEWLLGELDRLQQAATRRDVEILKEHLRNIVPEYQSAPVETP